MAIKELANGLSPKCADETEDGGAQEAVGALTTVFRFLRPYLRPHRLSLGLLALGILIETSYDVAFPLSLKYLIDDALYQENRRALVWILIVLGILGTTISCVGVACEYLNARLGATIIRDIRERLFEQLQSVSLQFYSRMKTGEVMSRFSTDLDEVEGAVGWGLWWGLMPLLEVVTAVILMFYLNWQLALAASLIWPLTLIAPRYLSARVVAATYRKKELEADTLSVVQENVGAQALVRAFGLQLISRNWFHQRNVSLAKTSTSVSFLAAMVERLVSTAVILLHLLILGFGAWLTFRKRITIGTLVTFESVFWELSYNIGYVSKFFPEVVQAAGSIRHINDLLEEPRFAETPNTLALPPLEREIVFDDVSFSYRGEGSQLKNVSFRIPCGFSAAIVGPSGSGKSTVLNLLLRLYEPTAGSVKIDGHDLAGVTRESLIAQIAIVFQESVLFNTSFRENIRLGRPDATDIEVEAAARGAEIHDFISSLRQGYETKVGECGNQMSGGQRQRIAIARAIIRNPAILILDEATSALDRSAEAAIIGTLKRLATGRTVIWVTHRLTSVVGADRIFVLDRGQLVEQGTHQELIRRNGMYLELLAQQVVEESSSPTGPQRMSNAPANGLRLAGQA
jgi:ATP-binding cassette subfamily B protein